MQKSKLSICIPTYNRAEILFENLLLIIQVIRDNNINVYISDDSSNNVTKDLYNKYFINEKLIHYRHNNPSYGHDTNCYKTIEMSNEEYIWYIGDSMIIKNDSFNEILNYLNEFSPDILCFNCDNRTKILPETKIYNNDKQLLLDLGWHLTMSGVTIYKKEMLNFNLSQISEYKNFPQLALIFLILNKNKNSKVHWINKKYIYGNKKKTSYWSGNQFEVFITDLKNSLKKLPNNFELNLIDSCIKKHTVFTGIINYRSLLVLRSENKFNYKIFQYNRFYISKYSNNLISLTYLISIFPIRLIKNAINFKKNTLNS